MTHPEFLERHDGNPKRKNARSPIPQTWGTTDGPIPGPPGESFPRKDRWGPRTATDRSPSRNGLLSEDPASLSPQHATQTIDERIRGRRLPHEPDEVSVSIYVVPGREDSHRARCLRRQMVSECREKSGRLPRKGLETSSAELIPADSNQVRAFPIDRGPQHRSSVLEATRDRGPVYLVEPGTIAPDHDELIVSLGKGVGERIGQARPKAVPPLTRVRHLENWKATLVDGAARVPIESRSDPTVFRIVLPYELLVPPLALGAVAKKQDGGMSVGDSDKRNTQRRKGSTLDLGSSGRCRSSQSGRASLQP